MARKKRQRKCATSEFTFCINSNSFPATLFCGDDLEVRAYRSDKALWLTVNDQDRPVEAWKAKGKTIIARKMLNIDCTIRDALDTIDLDEATDITPDGVAASVTKQVLKAFAVHKEDQAKIDAAYDFLLKMIDFFEEVM